ncbi:hypothetical protein CS063_06240 [Sporanaerobium hydrogeniformans]|uniref:Uncharacterized protein n=1 Tax=Sporanaerobium hydrogeniformans TaxID=3072179 RepID=A0AC61DFD9_9FIRM|nr:LCP family protein [Sporanaerobium hydrogeniformans]PHV71287.1 hypothetical protein CS063_06240 [Sporanaerobium hydrogeniformans]
MKKKKSSKNQLWRLFIKSACITLIIGLVIIAAGVWAYKHFFYTGDNNKEGGLGFNNPFTQEKNINKTLAVFGVDIEGYRTDVIFLVNFNSETGKVKVISVPRDTYVAWTPEQQQMLKEEKGYTISVSKINEMSAYSGMDHLRDFTIAQIEDLLDITIDNYVVVTLDAFRKIVDEIGGVEVDVPMAMHYEDPYQDLYIHLEQGLQTLDGEHAEMLVRFRKGYAEGDVGRIKTQQLFLEAFAKKILDPSIITKVPQLVPVLISSVKTDVLPGEISTYYKYMKDFDTTNLTFDIIPGEGKYIGNKSYYVIDEVALPEFIDRVIHDKVPEPEPEPIVDKNVTIEILNGGGIKGAAGTAKQKLESEGYQVSSIGNYTEETLQTTTIYTKDKARGLQFKTYYPNAIVIQKDDQAVDVQIILGSNQ